MAAREPFAVIWDVDGTLVDTAELHWRAWVALSAEQQLEFTRDHFVSTFGWRNEEIIPHVYGDRYTPEQGAALSDRKEALYREEARKGVALLPGVHTLIHQISAAKMTQGVGSSAPRKNVDLIIEVTQIDDHIAAVVSGDDVSAGKPNPEVFLKAAELLQVRPERCIVIEDATVGVRAARSGGMKSVGVGFVGHHSLDDLREAGANLVVQSLEEVSVEQLEELFT